MCGVVHGFQEVHVAGRTTHIFRRASIFASQAHRPVVTPLLRWQALLDGDDVFPPIAEVVVVAEGLDLFTQDGANGELSFIEHVVAADPFLVEDTVASLLYVPVM
ncbi:hypothetical protein D3C78_1190280 [compost metagenome]